MGTAFAFILLSAGVAGLFYLDRDRRFGNSKALWLPVIWLWIVGSRPLSDWLTVWFGFASSGPVTLDAQLDGSPIDAFFALLLLVAGVAVLFQRRQKAASMLKDCAPLLIYFLYCLVSCLWSPFPDVAFKRWVKADSDLVMVMIVVTDPRPIMALQRLFSRVGFVLLPASIFLIRYTIWGRAWGPDGSPTNTGVTTNKNTLGLITFFVALGALWTCIDLLRSKRRLNRKRRFIAQVALLVFGMAVLQQAHSSTSVACMILGSFLILATSFSYFRKSPRRAHALFLTILLLGGVSFLFGGEATVAGALGRDSTLSDRTKIWAAVIPVCPNPVVGAGFESFWNGYGKFVTKGLSKYERGLNSAHDGYIEVYLNLGWIGVALIGMLLVSGYFRAQASFRRNPRVGSLMLGLIASTAIYSITEAGFRIMTPTWIALLLVCAGARSLGLTASREWDELGLGVPDESQKTDTRKLPSEPFTEAEPDPSFAAQNARFGFSKISSGNRWV